MISEEIKQSAIRTAEKSNAVYLTSIATNILKVTDFEPNNFDEKKITFENYFNNIKNDETLRIKVWAKDGTIIYSDGGTIIGDNFASNPRFQNSINGQLLSQIKDPVDLENIDEVGYEQLMEIYVPIYLNQPEPVGVIELYFSMDSINESVNTVTELVLIIIFILIGFISLLIIIFSVTIARISQQSIKQERFFTIGELSARIAHDMRNPLNIIRMNFELLILEQKDPISEITKKRMNRIEKSLDRMTYQVNDVLDFVRTKPLSLKEISLKSILSSSFETIHVPKEIKIIRPKLDIILSVDPQQIETLFSNIITNSIQSLGTSGRIDIKFIENLETVEILIMDSGDGIPIDKFDKIFDPLFTTKPQGTGLGLASCKTVVTNHGGTISVKNNPTTFTVTLPKTLEKTDN